MMNILDRIFLTLYSLLIGFFSLLFIFVPFNQWIYHWTSTLFNQYAMDWKNIFIPIFFLGISIRFLISGIKRGKYRDDSVTRHTAYGEIKISLQAIEGMAQKSARGIIGLKDIKAIAKKIDDGLLIKIKALALTDINIPEVTNEVQKNVKEYIEGSTGIPIKEIKVIIDDIAIQNRGRVE